MYIIWKKCFSMHILNQNSIIFFNAYKNRTGKKEYIPKEIFAGYIMNHYSFIFFNVFLSHFAFLFVHEIIIIKQLSSCWCRFSSLSLYIYIYIPFFKPLNLVMIVRWLFVHCEHWPIGRGGSRGLERGDKAGAHLF